jgi:aspartate carbamoyltransferase catalytic subunit
VTREFNSPTSLAGRSIAIVGDIKHSRVARSNIDVFTRLGATVILVAPPHLLPTDVQTWGVEVKGSIDEVVGSVDVLYMLRMQLERMESGNVGSLREYSERYALTQARVDQMGAASILMHPGPMNRGVEMMIDPSEFSGSRILQQVSNGVSVRMAVLFTLLGNGSMSVLGQGADQ